MEMERRANANSMVEQKEDHSQYQREVPIPKFKNNGMDIDEEDKHY